MDSVTDAPALEAGPGVGDDSLPTSGPAQAVPSRRAAVARSAFVIGVLVVVFGLILPRFIDYDEVIAAFRDLTFQQLLLMTGLAVVAWAINGLPFVVLIPGLSIRRGTQSYLILGGIGASIPLGPWNMGILWVVVRGWGVGVHAATSGIGLYGVINQLGKLATPLLAWIALLAVGTRGQAPQLAIVLTALSTVVLFVAIGLMVAILRSDRAASWLARTGQRVATSILARLGREGRPDVDGAIRRFRGELGEVVRRRGLAAFGAAVLAQLTWCFVLIAALRIVGIRDSVLSAADIFAVFALVNVLTIIPISPGGAGVPELLYIAGLSAIAGAQNESVIAAGVFLFRLFQWFVPIPIAWVLLKVARRGKPMLPTTAELRAYARDDAAPAAVAS
jgi:uncharacterized membrane protein YbhN (UPF0104 family)